MPAGRLSCSACGALFAAVEGRMTADTAAAGDAPPDDAAPGAPAPGPEGEPARIPVAPEPSAADAAPPGVVGSIPGEASAPSITPEVGGLAAPPEAIAQPLPPVPPIPGGYLRPSIVTRRTPATVPPPQAVPDPAARALAASARRAMATRVPVLDLPFAIAPGAGPRLVAAGALLGVVAFVLPWVPDSGVVVGGAAGSGYFSTWGLAAVGNVIPFMLAWACLVLAVLPNRAPRAVSLGGLPIGFGGALAGVSWTYLIAPTGTGIGIWFLAASACLLLAGGSLVARASRAGG